MTTWRKTINIKKYLNDDELPVNEAMRMVLDALAHDQEFCEAEEGWLLGDLQDAVAFEDVDWFNEVLERVYAFADERQIGLGFVGDEERKQVVRRGRTL